MEMALGQFSSLTSIHLFSNFSPLFKGTVHHVLMIDLSRGSWSNELNSGEFREPIIVLRNVDVSLLGFPRSGLLHGHNILSGLRVLQHNHELGHLLSLRLLQRRPALEFL